MGSLVFNQIKLVGFKSFVDPTDFVIEPGLTGIVGPNGCGKSNLLEAIRWVMGANSAKAMRGKGMDDVIFSGTKQRPGRNQAHVTLTIDNAARIAPPMFNDDDTLEVSRVITMGQGSKYKVNGKTVRAKDIQLLFADASTGANSPALVRQGQINELIAAKPSNRRKILEEAAGISGLHTRRHEAELRLRAAETNLSRLDDILQQIESQLLSLRRQSRQAARYKRLAGEIFEYNIEQLESDLARETGIVEDSADAEKRLKAEFEELSAVKDMSAALDEASDIAQAAIAARSSLETDYNELTRKTADQNARLDSTRREAQQSENRLKRVSQDYDSAKAKLENIESQSGQGGTSNLFASAVSEALDVLESARTSEQKLASARIEAETADQSCRDDLSTARQDVTKLTAERDALNRVVSRANSEDWTPALSKLDVQKGYEQALAAALGEDLDAAIGENAPMTWQGASAPSQILPNGVTPLSDFVKAPAELAARLSQIGLVEADQMDGLQKLLSPGQRLVSQSGRVLRWDGFVIEAEAETSAAIRLKQQTRLSEITSELADAEAKVEAARVAFEEAREARRTADEAAKDARKALPDLERRERAAQAALTQFETDVARETAQKRALEDQIERLSREKDELTKQHKDAQAALSALENIEDLSGIKEQLEEKLRAAREDADDKGAAYRSLKNEMDARTSRLKAVETERANWARRYKSASERVTQLERRMETSQTALMAATAGPDPFEDRRNKLFAELQSAENRRSAAADALVLAEGQTRDAESKAKDCENAHATAREQRAAAQARLSAAQERITETQARIDETLSCEPDELTNHLGDLDPGSNLSESDIERKLDRLSQERERMGGVNLRADEEAVEQEERLAAMSEERTDLIAAIARLREGIDESDVRWGTSFDSHSAHLCGLPVQPCTDLRIR